MALFRRGNKNNVPAEIQEYYQTERRERAGIAWLLAFGTLVVTILLAAGIFYGGRWAWREIAGNDDPQVAQNGDQEQQQPQDNPTSQAPENNQPAETTPEQSQDQPEQGQQEQAPAESEQPQPGRGADTPQEAPAATENQQGSTAGESTEQEGHVAGGVSTTTPSTVPETGPGSTAAIFAAVSVFGYIIHRYYTRKAE